MDRDMSEACVLLTARCPDPKLAKAALSPFYKSADGVTTTSTSGFVLLHGQHPLVVTSAAAVVPLLRQQRRQQGSLVGASHADLAPGAQLHATVACACGNRGSPADGGSRGLAGASGSSSLLGAGSSTAPAKALHRNSGSTISHSAATTVELRLLGLAAMPGVQHALLQLLAAPSIAGPGGWSLGWLHHSDWNHPQHQHQHQHQSFLDRGSGSNSSGSFGGDDSRTSAVPGAAAAAAAGVSGPARVNMLEAACHVAVLVPVNAAGAATLKHIALPWPVSSGCGIGSCGGCDGSSGGSLPLFTGQQVAAVGAPFGALSPQHFSGLLSRGIVSAVLPAASSSNGGSSRGGSGGSGRGSDSAQASQLPPAGPAAGRPGGALTAAAAAMCTSLQLPVLTQALVLSDVRCAPGFEGGPVFTAVIQGQQEHQKQRQRERRQQQQQQEQQQEQQQLVGMLLPPLKAPAAQVEWALIAPAAAVAAAVEGVVAASCSVNGGGGNSSDGSRGVVGPAAAAASDNSSAEQCSTNTSISGSSGSGGFSTASFAAQAAGSPRGPAAGPAPAAVAAALAGVVALATNGGWATGVVVSPAGHILTNAHLLQPAAASIGGNGGGGSGRPAQLQLWAADPTAAPVHLPAHAAVQVLLPFEHSSSSAGNSSMGNVSRGSYYSSACAAWVPAEVLHVFGAPLDLAVLQVRQQQQHGAKQAQHGGQSQQSQQSPWHPLVLSQQPPCPGQPVYVVGFPVFNPRGMGHPGPLVTSGNVARVGAQRRLIWLGGSASKVVPVPSRGHHAMLLTTAAVHSGASGGAVLDAATGQLVGLVTSNAKHSSSGGNSSSRHKGSRGHGGRGPGSDGAGSNHHYSSNSSGSRDGPGPSMVLPHLNFSIPAAQLAAVVEAALAAGHAGSSPAALAAAAAAWRAADKAAAANEELQQVWRLGLQGPLRQHQEPDTQARQPGMSAFGGAAPPAKLLQLLSQLESKQGQQQQQQQGQQPRSKL